MPSLPSASTSCEGVAPGASIRVALQPPRSASLLSSDCQFGGAQKLLKISPAWKRIIASPPLHGSPGLVKVLPVTTNRSVPSVAASGDTAVLPDAATDGIRCPGHDVGRIVDWYPNNPSVVHAAVASV